ncbi:MAG: hypothetical protein KF708_05700 [Pirellulales bacterium]|nr:hypothetical protein [Pirellulales bacterium]
MNSFQARVATPYVDLSPRAARRVLALFCATVLGFVLITLSPWRSGYADSPERRPSDVQLYAAEVARIQAGEGYYEAAGVELRARGYPTRSVFNWRTPLPMWFLGMLPKPAWGKVLLASAALATLFLAMAATVDDAGIGTAALGLLLLGGALLPCFVGELYVMPVVWAGTIIALSLSAMAAGYRKTGIAIGLAAPFLRELALLFSAIMFVDAWRTRRRDEALAWGGGIVAFLAFYGWHASTVHTLIQPGDRSHYESWLQFGGAPFLLSLSQMNCYLLLLPQWVTGIYLPLALLGFASWQAPWAQRMALVSLSYLALFALVGQSFNQYWGMLFAPLLCLGAARGAFAIRDLCRAAARTEFTRAVRA